LLNEYTNIYSSSFHDIGTATNIPSQFEPIPVWTN